MDVRIGMKLLAHIIGGLSILWLGLGLALASILLIADWFSPGAMAASTTPGAYLAWTFVMPAAVGLVLASIVSSVGLRRS